LFFKHVHSKISGSFSSYLFTHQLDGGPCGEAPGKAALGVAPDFGKRIIFWVLDVAGEFNSV